MSTMIDQRKMIDALRYKTSKMVPKDRYDFDMYVKRDKDDEDLDSISMKRLREIFEKYADHKDK
jgi:uncharacterized protein (DUF2236 family)